MKKITDYAELVKAKHALNKTIAPVEDGASMAGSYTSGKQFIRDSVLYSALTSIAAGTAWSSLTLDTDYEVADDVSTQIAAVNQTLTNETYNVNDTAITEVASDDLLPIYDTSATGKKKIAVSNFIGGLVSNPNLLDNPWFTVNQRGHTSYSYGYTVDRWAIGYGDVICNVTNNGITLSSSILGSNFVQFIEEDFYNKFIAGKDVTLSVLFSDGRIESATGHAPVNTSYYQDAIIMNITNTCTATLVGKTGENEQVQIRFTEANSDSVSIKAVKLELGSVSTLAQDTAPNYQQELAKCQRYFYRHKGAYEYVGYFNTATNFRANLALPVPMRAIPSMTLETPTDYLQCGIYDAQGSLVQPSAIAVDTVNSIVGQPEILLNSTVATHTQNICGVQRFNLQMDLSADL